MVIYFCYSVKMNIFANSYDKYSIRLKNEST